MISSVTQVLLVYWREPMFRILFGVFVVALFMRPYEVFQEMLVRMQHDISLSGLLLWLFGVLLTFMLGLMIKFQFATHRAHLVPGYRRHHLVGFIVIYILLGLAGIWWVIKSAQSYHQVTSMQIMDVILAGATFSLMNIVLGYVSAGLFIFICYLLWTVLGVSLYINFQNVLGLSHSNLLMVIIFVIGFILLIVRLSVLKQEHIEYHFLCWWFGKQRSIRTNANSRLWYGWLIRLQQLFGVKLKEYDHRIKYGMISNLVARWAYLYRQQIIVAILIVIVSLIVLPCFIVYIRFNTDSFVFLLSSLRQYLFLTIYPAIFATAVNQFREGLFGYEMLKPVDQQEYLVFRLWNLLITNIVIWLWIFLVLVCIPSITLHIPVFNEIFCYLLCFIVSFTLTLLIGYIRLLTTMRAILVGVIVMAATVFLVIDMTLMTTDQLIITSLIWLLIGILSALVIMRKWKVVDY